MSAKRARWNGSHEVLVFDPQGTVNDPPIDTVVPGGLLSTDVPATVRDELLARPDWSEVKQDDKSTTEEKK
jgi:hypothetical protein